MRKRKRDHGTYVDEDTGEVTTVQTTKQAKRNHQKSGKWYKEPTEQEIRAWDREEKRQAAADKAARREENKKANAIKRIEKEAKEQALKQQLFDTGKITFTQTLAKKDRDQLNLHSWFGGRPQTSKPDKQSHDVVNEHGFKDGLYDKEHDTSDGAACGHAEHQKTRRLSQRSDKHGDGHSRAMISTNTEENPPHKSALNTMAHPPTDDDLLKSSHDFDVAEDSDDETEVLEPEFDQVNENSSVPFKIPPLPAHSRRPPLSPMSKSDLNIRASQTREVSSFKNKLEKADITVPSSTQAVRDVLSGICTQDLVDDLDDEYLSNEDKENEQPGPHYGPENPKSQTKASSPFKHALPTRCTQSPEQNNKSFTTTSDPCDYDSIFAELDAQTTNIQETEDFDDCGLDDATLLSLPPATQLVSSAKKLEVSKSMPVITSITTRTPKQPLKKIDSFAVEGLDDEDLQQALEEFERSQKKPLPTPSTSISASIVGSNVSKKKRFLPWKQADWESKVHAGNFDDDAEEIEAQTQDTVSSSAGAA